MGSGTAQSVSPALNESTWQQAWASHTGADNPISPRLFSGSDLAGSIDYSVQSSGQVMRRELILYFRRSIKGKGKQSMGKGLLEPFWLSDVYSGDVLHFLKQDDHILNTHKGCKMCMWKSTVEVMPQKEGNALEWTPMNMLFPGRSRIRVRLQEKLNLGTIDIFKLF